MWRWCQQITRSTLLRTPTLSSPGIQPNLLPAKIPAVDKFLKDLGSRVHPSRQDGTTIVASGRPVRQNVVTLEPPPESSQTARTHGRRHPQPVGNTSSDVHPPKVTERRKSRTLKKFDALTNTATTPTEYSTLTAMLGFLGGDLNPSSSSLAPRDIRSLFYSLKERSLLRKLSADDFTKLIALFGYLSNPSHVQTTSILQETPTLFRIEDVSRLARRLKKEERTYWDFVGVLGREKMKLGMELSHTDRYWIMRRNVADVLESGIVGDVSPDEISSDVKQSIHWARVHYRFIASSYHHPEVHLPFFRILLSFGLVDEAIFRFMGTVNNREHIHISFRQFAWELLLKLPQDTSLETKEKLVQFISMPHLTPSGTSDARLETGYSPDIIHTLTTGWQLSDLTKFILSCITKPNTTSSLIPWVSAFIDQHILQPRDIELVFGNLYAMALINAPASVLSSNKTPLTSASSSGWGLLCALVLCERITGMEGRTALVLDGDMAKQLRPLTSTLWESWQSLREDFPPNVNLAILTSFAYLAGRTKNAQLLALCASAVRTFPTQILTSPTYSSSLCHLVGELAIASVVQGEPVSTVIRLVQQYFSHPGNVAEALSLAASRISVVNPEMANKIDASARRSDLDLLPEARRAIAVALAHRGEVKLAHFYLRNGDLGRNQQVNVLEAIAKGLHTHRPSIDWDFAGALATDMRWTFRQELPSTGTRNDFQDALWIIMDAGRPTEAVSIVHAIGLLKRDFFSPQYLTKLLHELANRRQFQLSRVIFTLFQSRYPKYAGNWFDFLLKAFHQGGAEAQWKALRRYRWILPNFDIWNDTMYGRFRMERSDARRLGYIALSDSVPVRYHGQWMKLMLDQRLRRKSRMFYYNNQSKYSPRLRNRMANDLIESIFRSNTQRPRAHLRIVLETMNEVQQHSDFKPDRVTFNIVMKGILRLDLDMNAKAIRTLFNHVIQSGYPNGDPRNPKQPVFPEETEQTVKVMKGFNFPEIDEAISYERHVQPLYRMFIRALYIRGDLFGARRVTMVLKRVRAQDKGRRQRRWLAKLESKEAA